VERNPTECGVNECDREASKGKAMARRRAAAPHEIERKERKKEFVLTELNARENLANVLCVKFFIHQDCGLFIPVTRCEYAITSKSHVLLNIYMTALMALKGGSNKNTCVG